MTKEEYEKYDDMLFCSCCKRKVPKEHMCYKKVYKDGHVTRCNVCEWIKRHKGIPVVKSFTEEDILNALHFIIYNKSNCLNDLSEIIKHSVADTVKLFQSLKVGNKKCLVKSYCECCGKEIFNHPNVYTLHENLYCSKECYWMDKTNKIDHGVDSKFYNRIETSCTYCGKLINIIPSDFKKTNSYGDNHNFCSQQCYWKFRSKYYVGEKSNAINIEWTDELREKQKINLIKNARSSTRFNSSIQIKINELLDSLNIKYERGYMIKYYAVDNYLLDYNLIIEVMGDYWHSSPLKYNENKYMINEMQQNTLLHDKQKHTYIKNHNNIEILYLWETDINKNINMCKNLILKYINNNGILDNYHSFNWSLKDDILTLNNEIIIPYQNMNTDEYKDLIKKKIG